MILISVSKVIKETKKKHEFLLKSILSSTGILVVCVHEERKKRSEDSL